jgi:hypothetical protein
MGLSLERRPFWDTRLLEQFLIERRFMPFKWGENDCALFVADAVEAITGVDIATDFRGYTDQPGAFQAIRVVIGAAAGATVTVEHAAEYCAGKYGFAELELPLKAQRGDICSIEDGGRIILALVSPNGREVVTAGELGLRRFPITQIRRAWHV